MDRGHLDIWARAAMSAVPYAGGPAEIVYSGYRNRATGRAMDLLGQLTEHFEDPAGLDARLASSEPLDALFGRALRAAVDSGLADKRVALGRVVVAALDDDALIDRSALLVDALAQVDAPHVAALVAIRHAVQLVQDRGEWPVRARGAGHEIISSVVNVGREFEDSVIRALKNLGLLFAGEATDEWFVHDLTPFGYELLGYLAAPGDAKGDDQLAAHP